MSRITASSILRSLATVLSVLVMVSAAAGAGPAAPENGGTDGRELAELVARESFKGFGRSTEGTVVARFHDSKDPEPLGVWVYQGGALREAENEKLDQALGADRGLWPPYTLLFATVPEGKNKLRLDLMVRYDMGLMPDSRGGSSSTWQLERRKGRWVLVGEAVTMNID